MWIKLKNVILLAKPVRQPVMTIVFNVTLTISKMVKFVQN